MKNYKGLLAMVKAQGVMEMNTTEFRTVIKVYFGIKTEEAVTRNMKFMCENRLVEFNGTGWKIN